MSPKIDIIVKHALIRGMPDWAKLEITLVWKKDALGSWKTCISGVCGHKNWVLVVVVRKLFLFPSLVGEKLSERKWKNYFNEISLHSLALFLFKTRFSFQFFRGGGGAISTLELGQVRVKLKEGDFTGFESNQM